MGTARSYPATGTVGIAGGVNTGSGEGMSFECSPMDDCEAEEEVLNRCQCNGEMSHELCVRRFTRRRFPPRRRELAEHSCSRKNGKGEAVGPGKSRYFGHKLLLRCLHPIEPKINARPQDVFLHVAVHFRTRHHLLQFADPKFTFSVGFLLCRPSSRRVTSIWLSLVLVIPSPALVSRCPARLHEGESLQRVSPRSRRARR